MWNSIALKMGETEEPHVSLDWGMLTEDRRAVDFLFA
jgi:hypothetical protein